MSQSWIPVALKVAVRQRAGGGCEYCRTPEAGAFFPYEADHIVSTRHRGETVLENRALASIQCNRFKGPNIASVDPETNMTVPLFNPRTDQWTEHFRREGGRIIPLTPVARATAALPHFSDPDREEARQNLWRAGRYPG